MLTRDCTPAPAFAVSQIRYETVMVIMRDGVRLATDLYLPPVRRAPTIVTRTPYGRATDPLAGAFLCLARRGYVAVAQDCRGTGGSEPDSWDYYMYETEDGNDLVEWIRWQEWFDGFIAACGSSYAGQTQWCMATHPSMSTIVPEVSGLGIAHNTAHLYMFLNAHARSVGKGREKVPVHFSELEQLMVDETLAGGFFNEPLQLPLPEALLSTYPNLRAFTHADAQRELWQKYCGLPSAGRATFVKDALKTSTIRTVEVESLTAVFGHRIVHDAHTIPHVDPAEICRSFHAPALMITGWYDWALNDALATWELVTREAQKSVRLRSRLIITPSAHNTPGYHEGMGERSELQHNHRLVNHVGLLLLWYAAVRQGMVDTWPRVIYYLMCANEWRVASEWPPPETRQLMLHLSSKGTLIKEAPTGPVKPDRYIYNPTDPTPTVGGGIVSYVYPPGSVDVSKVQRRTDVLSYTTAPLERDIDVVGPLRMVLYASSSAVDTDFVARFSDVFPDGRAIQLQSGILRARFRRGNGDPELLEPGRIYRFEIDLWATANRFKAGHRMRVDLSSADFPHYDRNTNRGGEPGAPVAAQQTIYLDHDYPSHLVLSVLE